MGWTVHHDGDALASVTLASGSRDRPRLLLESAWPRSIRLSLDGRPLFWARVWSDYSGWTWLPNEPADRVAPSFDAIEMRARPATGTTSYWLGWIERFCPIAMELCGSARGARIDLVTSAGTKRYRDLSVCVDPSRAFEGGDDGWSGTPLPLRPWPSASEGRVKAFRKLMHEGVAAPALLLWISGLRTSVVLDGHARMVAADLEQRPLPSLTIVGVREGQTVAPDAKLEAALMPLLTSGDERAAHHALHTLHAATRTDWRAMSRATPMDAAPWAREVRKRLRSLPRTARAALGAELLLRNG